MSTFLEKILAEKEREVAKMSREEILPKRKAATLYETLKNNPGNVQLIAEVKRASPSKGIINQTVDIAAQALSYEAAGAAAISVLTDETYFKGTIQDLRQVTQAVHLPVLCKDFIIDDKQLIRARNNGATICLLIVAALTEKKLSKLFSRAKELDLEVLMEVHDENELKKAESIGAKLIGVNNRNLHTFEVNIAVSERLAVLQQSRTAFYISESGFKTVEDVKRIRHDYQAVLVGEALMRKKDPTTAARNMKVERN